MFKKPGKKFKIFLRNPTIYKFYSYVKFKVVINLLIKIPPQPNQTSLKSIHVKEVKHSIQKYITKLTKHR